MGATECAHSSRPHSSASTARGLATWPGHAGGKPRHAGTVLEATHPASAKGTARSPSSAPTAARDTQPPARRVPKRLTLVNKSKVAQKKVERPQAAAPPTKNAWTKKFVPTMEDFPQTLTTVGAPPTLKHTVEVSRPQVARPKPVATKTVVADSDDRHPMYHTQYNGKKKVSDVESP